MAHIVEDRVKETTTTTGTGSLTLAGAATGYKAFSDVCANTDTVYYVIDGGAEWEVGLGTWGTGNVLARTTVLNSSNAGAAVNFSAGTKSVFLSRPAASFFDITLNTTAPSNPRNKDLWFDTDEGVLRVWYVDSSGGQWVDTNPARLPEASSSHRGAMVVKAADQIGGNYTGTTFVAWDEEAYDTDMFHDNVTNNSRLTFPFAAGLVELFGAVEVQNITADTYIGLYLYKNGSADWVGSVNILTEAGSTTQRAFIASGPVQVIQGDYFELRLQSETDTTVDVIAARSSFAMKVIDTEPEFSGCLIKKSADQTGANYTTATAMTFNTEVYDVGGWHDTVTNSSRITIPADVNYVELTGTVLQQLGGTDQWAYLSIRKNGSEDYDGSVGLHTEIGTTASRMNVKTAPIPVVQGDYFELFFQVEADTSLTITAASTTFSARKIA